MMDDGDAQEMKFVVDQLNRPPFNMNITLVTLSQKNQMELLQVLKQLMASIFNRENNKQTRNNNLMGCG